jgi:hypothetical protein
MSLLKVKNTNNYKQFSFSKNTQVKQPKCVYFQIFTVFLFLNKILIHFPEFLYPVEEVKRETPWEEEREMEEEREVEEDVEEQHHHQKKKQLLKVL